METPNNNEDDDYNSDIYYDSVEYLEHEESICGKNNKRLSYRKKEWKLNSYLDVYTMVKSVNLDVVLICNENNLHFKEAKKAVKAVSQKWLHKGSRNGSLTASRILQNQLFPYVFTQKCHPKIRL